MLADVNRADGFRLTANRSRKIASRSCAVRFQASSEKRVIFPDLAAIRGYGQRVRRALRSGLAAFDSLKRAQAAYASRAPSLEADSKCRSTNIGAKAVEKSSS